jgi:hypothetical protein
VSSSPRSSSNDRCHFRSRRERPEADRQRVHVGLADGQAGVDGGPTGAVVGRAKGVAQVGSGVQIRSPRAVGARGQGVDGEVGQAVVDGAPARAAVGGPEDAAVGADQDVVPPGAIGHGDEGERVGLGQAVVEVSPARRVVIRAPDAELPREEARAAGAIGDRHERPDAATAGAAGLSPLGEQPASQQHDERAGK